MADFCRLPSGIVVPLQYAESGGPVMQEIATVIGGNDITRGYLLPDLLQPTQDDVLLERGAGDLTLWRELLRDDQVQTGWRNGRMRVWQAEWDVEPGGTMRRDKQAADSLKAQLQAIAWDNTTDKQMYGEYYGYTVAEMMWARDGREVMIDDIRVRERRRFAFDGLGRLRMRTMSQIEGEIMPPRKFWAYATGADNDDEPYGIGLGHWLYWPVWLKRNGLKLWLIRLDKFGAPTPWGQYPVGSTPEEKKRLSQTLTAFRTASWVMTPDGMQVSLLEAAKGSASYAELYDRMNEAVSKIISGHAASADSTPGRLGEETLAQAQVRALDKARADLVNESFNRGPARWLTDWNYPGAAYPRVYRRIEAPENLNALVGRDQKLTMIGYRPTLQYVTETYGGEYEDTGVPAAAPGTAPPAPEFVENGPAHVPDQDDIDRLADEGAGDWRPVMEPMIADIERVAQAVLGDGGGSEEFLARIGELFGAMDEDAFAELCAMATTKAAALGDATDNPAA